MCSSIDNRAVSTNSRDSQVNVRKRRCKACGHCWYSVEVIVNPAVVGWSRDDDGHGSKPCLRVPIELAVGKDAV